MKLVCVALFSTKTMHGIRYCNLVATKIGGLVGNWIAVIRSNRKPHNPTFSSTTYASNHGRPFVLRALGRHGSGGNSSASWMLCVAAEDRPVNPYLDGSSRDRPPEARALPRGCFDTRGVGGRAAIHFPPCFLPRLLPPQRPLLTLSILMDAPRVSVAAGRQCHGQRPGRWTSAQCLHPPSVGLRVQSSRIH